MTPTVSVAHTGITVRHLEDAVTFWVEAVGAELERNFELSGDFAADVTGVTGATIHAAVIRLGHHRIELLEYLEPAEREHFRPRPNDLGSWHLALDVDDLDAVAGRCAEHGWAIAGAVGTMSNGARAGTRFVYLHDRDGATLELIQRP